MRRLIIVLIVTSLGFYAYGKHDRHGAAAAAAIANEPVETQAAPELPPEAPANAYRCDGRVYCSQMTSCAEAKWFLRNCPGTKMDGEGKGDGVPCERQWCPHG